MLWTVAEWCNGNDKKYDAPHFSGPRNLAQPTFNRRKPFCVP